jgi:hypothetical protein
MLAGGARFGWDRDDVADCTSASGLRVVYAVTGPWGGGIQLLTTHKSTFRSRYLKQRVMRWTKTG